MSISMAYCGLSCGTCSIYLATFEPDKIRQQEMRVSIAKQCSELYGMNMNVEDVTDCDGCFTDNGRLFSGCLNCEIRKCACLRGIKSCAVCNDYACEKLKEFFRHDPEAQERLNEIRRNYC